MVRRRWGGFVLPLLVLIALVTSAFPARAQNARADAPGPILSANKTELNPGESIVLTVKYPGTSMPCGLQACRMIVWQEPGSAYEECAVEALQCHVTFSGPTDGHGTIHRTYYATVEILLTNGKTGPATGVLASNDVKATWQLPDEQACDVPQHWNITLTQPAGNKKVAVGKNVLFTAQANSCVTGTPFRMELWETNPKTGTTKTVMIQPERARMTDVLKYNTPTVRRYKAVVAKNRIGVAFSTEVTVTWGEADDSGNGNAWGGSVSLKASPASPTAGQNVTLTVATSKPTKGSDYIVKIWDPENNYIYDQCDTETGKPDGCTTTVPATDINDNTGCTAQGSGTCKYLAVVAKRGTNPKVTPPAAKSNVLTVTWH